MAPAHAERRLTRSSSRLRKGMGLLGLGLFLLVACFGTFHVHGGIDGWGHQARHCAICVAASQLCCLLIALPVFPGALFRLLAFCAHRRLEPTLLFTFLGLPRGRAPPRAEIPSRGSSFHP